jgi:hypothetical protein
MKQTESFGQQTKRSKNAADIKRKKAAKSSKYKSVKKAAKSSTRKRAADFSAALSFCLGFLMLSGCQSLSFRTGKQVAQLKLIIKPRR